MRKIPVTAWIEKHGDSANVIVDCSELSKKVAKGIRYWNMRMTLPQLTEGKLTGYLSLNKPAVGG